MKIKGPDGNPVEVDPVSEEAIREETRVIEPRPASSSDPRRRCYVFFIQSTREFIRHEYVYKVLESVKRLGLSVERKSDHIDLVLQSAGGDADAAFHIIQAIRACCNELDVLVPTYAKSAATLMALAADRIFMGVASELGPVDMQVKHPFQDRWLSAQDGTKCLDDLQRAAILMARDLIEKQGARFIQITQLERAQVFKELLHFAAETINPVMEQIDPWTLHECIRMLSTSQRYAEELLRQYMFRNHPDSAVKAKKTAAKLASGYPIHSYALLRQEARDQLELVVEDGEPRESWGGLLEVCRAIGGRDQGLYTSAVCPLDTRILLEGGENDV